MSDDAIRALEAAIGGDAEPAPAPEATPAPPTPSAPDAATAEHADLLAQMRAYADADAPQAAPAQPPAPTAPPAPAAPEALPAWFREWQQAQEAQQQQALAALMAQQQAYAPQPQAPAEPTDADLAKQMQRLGLDPTDPKDVYFFQVGRDNAGLRQSLGGQIQQLEHQIQEWRSFAAEANAKAQVGSEIERTLKPYGQVPAETLEYVRNAAAHYAMQGYPLAQAIEYAAQPVLPLLRQMQAATRAAPPPQPATHDPAALLALAAIGTQGKGGGGGRLLNRNLEIPVDQLERMLGA